MMECGIMLMRNKRYLGGGMGMAKVEASIGNHLDLPEFNVINRQESPSGDILYTVEPKEAPAKCPSCGGKLNIHKKSRAKGKRPRRVRKTSWHIS